MQIFLLKTTTATENFFCHELHEFSRIFICCLKSAISKLFLPQITQIFTDFLEIIITIIVRTKAKSLQSKIVNRQSIEMLTAGQTTLFVIARNEAIA
jgi:hypothetical protein